MFQTVLIVVHLIFVIALVGVVLLQRSEGGGLGIGGGGGFFTSRGTANVLTRATAILATLFFITTIGLTITARMQDSPASILDRTGGGTAPGIPMEDATRGSGAGLLDTLRGAQPSAEPAAPAAPAAPAQPTGPQVPKSE